MRVFNKQFLLAEASIAVPTLWLVFLRSLLGLLPSSFYNLSSQLTTNPFKPAHHDVRPLVTQILTSRPGRPQLYPTTLLSGIHEEGG